MRGYRLGVGGAFVVGVMVLPFAVCALILWCAWLLLVGCWWLGREITGWGSHV